MICHPANAGICRVLRAFGRRVWVSYLFTFERFLTGMTNFNPDHTSVTAQTLTSTRPAASPLSRTASSVISVGTFELFLGHAIHSMPAGARAIAARMKIRRQRGARLDEQKDEIQILVANF